MKNQFETLKNGKNAKTVFANPETKQIVVANKNSFGHNVICGSDVEFDNLARTYNLKRNQGKSDYTQFSFSQKDVESLGFILIKRGDSILF